MPIPFECIQILQGTPSFLHVSHEVFAPKLLTIRLEMTWTSTVVLIIPSLIGSGYY